MRGNRAAWFAHLPSELENSLEKGFEFGLEVAFDEVASVDTKEGRVEVFLTAFEGNEHADIAVDTTGVLVERLALVGEEVDGNTKVVEINEKTAIFFGEEETVGARDVGEDDCANLLGDTTRQQQGLDDGGREVLGEENTFRCDVTDVDGGEDGILALLVEVASNLLELGLGIDDEAVIFLFCGEATNPVVSCETFEQSTLAHEDAGLAVEAIDDRGGSRGEGGGESVDGQVLGFETVAEVGRNLLAEGFKGEEFDRNVSEFGAG